MAQHRENVDWIQIAKSNNSGQGTVRFTAEDELLVVEIGDGNLNDVMRVYTRNNEGKTDKSMIIKYSMPYVKCLGPSFPLGVERIQIEYKGLQKFHCLSPRSVPVPFFIDQDNNAVGMEDLQDYEQFRVMLIRGEVDMDWVKNIARHVGIVHRETHVGTTGAEALQQLDQQFENNNMLSLTEQFVFTRPFTEGDETNKCSPEVKDILHTIYGDEVVMETAKKMTKLFKEKKECLLHGDLHTGSVLVKGKDSRIIDLEFAFVGPAAFDVGMLLANYIFSYYRHMSIPEDNDKGRAFAQKMIEACHLTVRTYLDHMTAAVGPREAYVSNFMSDVAGFAGCEIIRRLVGAAHVGDFEGVSPEAERDCVGAGVRLLQAAHRIHDIDRMMLIALMLAY